MGLILQDQQWSVWVLLFLPLLGIWEPFRFIQPPNRYGLKTEIHATTYNALNQRNSTIGETARQWGWMARVVREMKNPA